MTAASTSIATRQSTGQWRSKEGIDGDPIAFSQLRRFRRSCCVSVAKHQRPEPLREAFQARAVAPLETERERQEKLDAVVAVEQALAMGDVARSGDVAVIAALTGRQVEALVMNADFAAPGWIDHSLNIAGAGDIPAEHPAGGDVANIIAVDLGEEMVRKAILGRARIEIVETAPAPGETGERAEAAQRLDALGGVAAMLRFSVLPDGSEG